MKTNPLVSALVRLCCLASITVALVASPPVNDNYADAQVISGSAIDVTGDNTEGTWEGSETNPGAYGGASVWYSWTAPATGWYTVHTSSTNPTNHLDTVLALFADGASVAAAVMLGHNDESVRWQEDFPIAVYPNSIGPSRLVFKATAGNVYRLAVHGYLGATGTFELHLASEATPEFVVSSVTFAPASADISSTEASSTATVAIQTANPFSYADFSLLRAHNGVQAAYDTIDDADFVSGSITDGIYTAEVTVPLHEQPGNWPVIVSTYSNTIDGYMQWTSIGDNVVEDNYLIPQSPASLTVVNNGMIDAEAPEITSFSGLPAAVDLADGDATFTITLEASDALSGVQFGTILLNNGAGISYPIAYFDGSSITLGDANSGTYSIPVTMFADYPQGPAGTYEVEVEITDVTTNQRRYVPAGESLPPGSTSTIVVSTTPPGNDDFANRVVIGGGLPSTTAGTTRFAALEPGESNLNDTTAASVWYEWTATATGWVSIRPINAINHNPPIGLFTGSDVATLQEIGRNNGSLPAGFGVKRPLVFEAQAGLSYKIAVYGDGVIFAQTGVFDLEIASAATPPVRVTSFSLTPATVDVGTGPQIVTLEFTVQSTAPLFPLGFLQANLTPSASTSGTHASVTVSSGDRISGTTTNGTYRKNLTIPGYTYPGVWNLIIETYSGTTFDRWTPQGQNIVQDAHIIPMTGGSVIVQNSVGVDEYPPALVTLTGLPGIANVSIPVPVTLTFRATDDQSGIASGQFFLFTSSGNSATSYGLASFTAANLISGDATNGTYQVVFNLTNFIQPGNYALNLSITDLTGKVRYYDILNGEFPDGSTSTITIHTGQTGYTAWANSQSFGPGGLYGELDDPNQDGTNNLLCYACNLPPYDSLATTLTPGGNDTAGLPAITVVSYGVHRRLRIEYLRRLGAATGLTYRPQFTSDLSASGPGGWEDAGIGTVTTIDSDWERVVIEDSVRGAPGRFGRVVVEYAAP